MKIKWVFFDVGSTLVDETVAYDHRVMDMIKSTNITFSEFDQKRRELSHLGYDGNSEAIKFFSLNKTPWHTEDEILCGDATCVLTEIKKMGYKIGIIANQNDGLSERLDGWGILHLFDLIVSSSDVGLSKPDENIFRIAMSRAIAVPEECLMVGDRLDNDIIPAAKVGMNTVWIKNGLSSLQNDSFGNGLASHIINSLTEIIDILK